MADDLVDWVSLFGFFSEAQALNLLRSRGTRLEADAAAELKQRLTRARDYVSSIAGRPAAEPRVEALVGAGGRIPRLEAGQGFRELVGGAQGWSFSMVELGKLRVFQPHINREHALALAERAPAVDDLEGAVSYCLPLDEEAERADVTGDYDPVQRTHSLASKSPDLRVLGSVTLNYATSVGGVGFLYGFGHPLVSVVEHRGLMLLKNGYHRAYALMKRGHRALPCVVVKTDDASLTGVEQAHAFPWALISSERAPLFEDFFSEAAVTAPWRRTMAVLTAHADVEILTV